MSDEQQRGGDSEEASQGEDQRGVHDRCTGAGCLHHKSLRCRGGQDDDAKYSESVSACVRK